MDSVHLLDGLTEAERSAVSERLTTRVFARGDVLLRQGDIPRSMYLLESGSLEVAQRADGEDTVLARLRPGDFCGELSLLTGAPLTATVRAVTDVSASELTGDLFTELVDEHPILYRNIGRIVAERLTVANRRSHGPHSEGFTLIGGDAPSIVVLGLAASVAFHTGRHTLVVLPEGDDPDDSVSGLGATVEEPSPDAPGRPRAVFLDAASDRREDVMVRWRRGRGNLLYVTGGAVAPAEARPAIELGVDTAASAATESGDGGRHGLGVRCFHRGGPWDAWIPAPDAGDLRVLRSGRLPPASPFSSACGRVVRRLFKLRIGVALGAGSAKGFAHLGVLEELERSQVPCDAISGASIGAAVAGMYATGVPAGAAREELTRVGAATFMPVLPRTSLLSHARVRDLMTDFWQDTRIEDCRVPLGIVAADLESGLEVVFRSGLLWSAVLASISIPGVYPPLRMGDRVLVDGGVVNPVPTRVVRALGADIVIGVRLSTRPPAGVIEEVAVEPAGRTPPLLSHGRQIPGPAARPRHRGRRRRPGGPALPSRDRARTARLQPGRAVHPRGSGRGPGSAAGPRGGHPVDQELTTTAPAAAQRADDVGSR